jgi:microcompartment protein CcmL/EutN
LIEQRVISGVHPAIFPAISSAVDLKPEEQEALGIIETFSASSIIDAADSAVKSAQITLFRVHLAMAVGGKGFLLLTGDVASVEAAVAAGSKAASDEGMLVSRIVIPAPRRELFGEFI